MSSTTTNLGLTKTTAAETIGQTWAASNESGGNFDIIDGKMGAVGDTSLQAQVNALNSKIANIVRSGSVSGQTDSTGDINVQLSASSYIPVAFKVTGGNMPTTAPRMFFQTFQGTGWFVKFINDSTLQNIANTTVEGIVYYLQI